MSQMTIFLERTEKRHQCSCETVYTMQTAESAPSMLYTATFQGAFNTNAFVVTDLI